MYKIVKADINHIPAIISLANKTWMTTYSSLISLQQINFMLQQFYNEQLLIQQMNDEKHHFLVLLENESVIGYSQSIELEHSIKLSKLYLATSVQGRGYGKLLFNSIEQSAIDLGYNVIELCVNRGNPAQFFYKKLGFKVVREEEFPIGKFWMNDYVMEKKIK